METIWFALILTGALGIVALIEKIRDLYEAHKAKQKTTAAEPIDGTSWLTYDSNGSVKEQGKELRRELYAKRKAL